MKIYLAHDYLNQYGGGERVLELFQELYPNAKIATITFDPKKLPQFSKCKPLTSFIQKLPFGVSKYKWYLTLMPKAVESMDFSDADLVLSDSSGFIKGIKVPSQALHVCYIHTSTRYLTVDKDYFSYTVPKFLQPITPWILNRLEKWDKLAASRPNYYIANSKVTASRVKKYYNRDVDAVVFPPVDMRRFYRKSEDKVEDYYLIAGRLMPYKRADLAVKACSKLGKKLVVIGTGTEDESLRQMAGPTIEFWGKVSDEKLRQAYAQCKGFIFPPLEDAGMTPLEVMACGRPVIAFGQGGALESIQAGKTGIFFDQQTVESLTEALIKFETMNFNSKDITAHAEQFSQTHFLRKIKDFIDEKLVEFSKTRQSSS